MTNADPHAAAEEAPASMRAGEDHTADRPAPAMAPAGRGAVGTGAAGPGADERELALLGDAIPVPGWIARGDGAFLRANRHWHASFPHSAPEAEAEAGTVSVAGEPASAGWQSLCAPEALPAYLLIWRNGIAAGEPFEMPCRLRGADGAYRLFQLRMAPVADAAGVPTRWTGCAVDLGAQATAERALAEAEAKYAVLTNTMPQMVWSTRPDGFHDYYNDRWYEFTGVAPGSTDGEGWNGLFHAEDQERAWDRWRHSLASGEDYEIEYRLRHHGGEYRWVLGRARPMRGEDGGILRWIGTCTDIDDTKRAAQQDEILSRELSHRIKNIFAVINGLINLTAARAPDTKPVMAALLGRIAALGRAHDFARPHNSHSQPGFGRGRLLGLLGELLAPYRTDRAEHVAILGEDVPIDDRSATPLALVFHELATNSAKYGALAQPGGQLRIETRMEGGRLVLRWTETGGPPVAGAPAATGFGTELADLSIRRQLGGEIEKDWQPGGLRVTITLDPARLYRPE